MYEVDGQVRQRSTIRWRKLSESEGVDGGKQWEPVRSRVVTTRLRLDKVGNQHQFFHLVSIYAPTFCAPQQVKDEFFADFQMLIIDIDKLPERGILMFVGDWVIHSLLL